MASEGKVPVFIAGDSHAKIFFTPLLQGQFPRTVFESGVINGATISGFKNPNSETQAFPIIWSRLFASKARLVVTMFGEVDVGFVIWLRAQKYGCSVYSIMEKVLSNYRRFLDEVSSMGRSVLCISAPLPTIPDGSLHGDVANARNQVTATQMERTELTLAFNRKMQQYCQQSTHDYLMLDPYSIGEDGLIARELVNPDVADHHYDPTAYSRLLADHLHGLAEENSSIRPYFLKN